ncbi:hypothetical protein CBM2623_A20117 [Cupriavidus taiwanensis]|nr:hypothetical protein CBM2608_A20116 [Cupriavidus taiwanensis]SPA27021.1 hypothetical protein CBM2623_A20117 [Cupriavidus taiwanensis]
MDFPLSRSRERGRGRGQKPAKHDRLHFVATPALSPNPAPKGRGEPYRGSLLNLCVPRTRSNPCQPPSSSVPRAASALNSCASTVPTAGASSRRRARPKASVRWRRLAPRRTRLTCPMPARWRAWAGSSTARRSTWRSTTPA